MTNNAMEKDSSPQRWQVRWSALRFIITLALLTTVFVLAARVVAIGFAILPVWLVMALPGIVAMLTLSLAKRVGQLVRQSN